MAGKKDIVEQALKLIAGGGEKAARTGIKAYHSSPHDFDKFDLSKIGTGEGNQVYGRGLYFAESPAVSGQGGDYWRQFWNKMKSGSEATAANAMWANKFDRDKAISSVERQARYYRDLSKPGKYGNGPDVEEGNRLLAEEYERALELLRDGGIVGPRTYEVNIETTPDKLIDWDKPALKQPDNVLSTIKPFYESIPERKQYGETFTGGDLYRDFVKRSGGVMHSPKIDAAGIPEVLPGGSEERATRFLASKGVPGLQYLDGISRKYGDGTRNYVIFDDKIVDIEKKYEDGGAVREGYSGKGRVVGDIVDQALKLVAGEGEEAAKTGIRAYHGSPHDFPPVRHIEMPDGTQLYQNMLENPNTPEGAKILQEYPLGRFDMSKIGTGEGAQAYGHGLYFAGNEGIARHYRDALSSNKFRYENVQPDNEAIKKFASQLADVENRQKNLSDPEGFISLDSNYDELESLQAEKDKIRNMMIMDTVNRNPHLQYGRMYEVNIAADPNTFLDWDKPLSEQPEFLDRLATSKSKYARELLALPDLKSPTRNVYGTDIGPMTGQDAFKNLAIATTGRVTGGPKTTDLLNKAGVPGIKYLDAGSRGAGEGTRNYVVFDDKLISIIRKYGIAGASAMLGYNLMENLDANQAQAATVADKEYQATQPEVRGGMLPPGMEPSGEMTSRIPSASERIYDYVRSVLGGDEATKGQRAETVMNIIDQTPLAVGPMAYDIGRGIAEKVAYADGGAVDPYAEEVASAKKILADKAYNDQSWSDWVGDAAENAVRTARSILPTALGGEGSVGISDIARGAYEGGKDAVMFPGDVITGKQALFDENGVPLESAVGRSFNTAATLGGASSVVPRPANSVGLFGGISSRTADKAAIREAMKMESKGASPDEIWDNTGWFRGADRRWRYEIPDIGTTVNSAALQLDLSVPTIQPIKSAKLGDYLQHPKFFAAYPQFRSMDVRTMPGSSSYGGMYYPRFAFNSSAVIDPRIELNENLLSNGSSQRSVLLHEIQHAIQNKEGFAPGTNIAAQSAGRINPAVRRYQEAVKNDPEMRELMSIRSSMDYKNQVNEANDLYEAEYRPRDDEIDTSSMSDIEKKAAYDAINKEYDERIKNMFPMIKQVEDLTRKINSRNIPLYMPTKKMLTPIEAYNQYAGETEARNVQSRMNWSEENLRGFRPWETQDFPYINQLLPENDVTWKLGYSSGGAVDDDITDALRIAKDVGGGTTPVMLEDAKGNKYDAQGNLIPPTAPGPAPARTPTPQDVGQRAANDPATFDALMQQYAVPDRDIAQYEATKAAVAAQPYETQQMTHVGEKPRREVTVDMPLFGGEYSLGTAPYDAASGMGTLAQTAYDWKTAPFYAIPLTAPIAAGMDVAEGVATEDPLTASLAIGFGPGGKYAKAAGIGAVNYFMDPAEAEAGPARWFSKAVEAARNVPMNKMTGEQALAMLRKGVSPEELKWIGADAFLPQQKQITKQDLVDYLAKNRVQTQDVVFGGAKPVRRGDVVPSETAIAPYRERWDELVAQNRAINEVMLLPPSERDADIDDLLAQRNDIQYEMDQIHDKAVDATIEEMGGLSQPVRYGPGSTYGEKYMTRGGEDYRETLITLPRKEFGNLYQSGHWEGIPNVVGHIRTQVLDVTPPGSNRPYKAFNVDEAQSDYAKSGREKGFVTAEDKASLPNLVKQYDDLNKQRREAERIVASGDDTTPEVREAAIRMADLNRQMMDLSDKMTAIRSGGVPVAPYVTSTQNWTDLSIKKALDQAMDAGADYFTYTPGDVHVDRYSLSNHLGEIRYNPENRVLEGLDKQGTPVISEYDVPPEKLDAYVGKEMADKIRDQDAARKKDFYSSFSIEKTQDGNFALLKNGKPGWGVYVSKSDAEEELKNVFNDFVGSKPVTFSGLDLKVGGEGMIDYYNNIYKKRVEKVVKDATGKKVQWEVIPVQTADGPREQLGFRITDMQDARFSDFNKGGRVTGSTKYADSDTVSRALALTSEV